MKIRFLPKSLTARLALVFWLVVFALVAVEFLILSALWEKAVLEHIQRTNWELAEDIAHQLRPVFRKNPSDKELLIEVEKIASVNHAISIYIVELNGIVRFAHDLTLNKALIPVEPIERFLQFTTDRSVPILGDHPDVPGEQFRNIFSAARIKIGDKPAYLYVMLQGKKSAYYSNDLREFYLLKGGIISTTIIGIFAGVIGSFLFFLVTTRFRSITKIVREISDGSSEKRVEVRGNDEIAVLGEEINRMVDTIAAHSKALEEKDRLRRELVANVSHDLGNPLASAQGYLENIHEKGRTASYEEREKSIVGALSNVHLVSQLVRDLLELSRLEAKEIQANFEAFSILDIVSEEIIPKLRPLAEKRQVALLSEHPEKLPLVYADIVMVQRIIFNLAENAIRYNREGGETKITLREKESDIEVEVSDSGPGIKKGELPRVFDRFFRAESSQKTRGSGLGLAIVKQLVEAHKKTISVESTVGEGTTFRFCLSVNKPAGTS